MPSHKQTISLTVILMVLLVLFLGASQKRDDPLRSTSLPPGATYAAFGPSPVGLRQLAIEAGAPLELQVWYPAIRPEDPVPETTYRYEIKMGDPLGSVAVASYEGQALPEAAYDLSGGPYPVVILSPGFSIGSSAYAWLTEHLASYGLVVISLEHVEHLDPGNELWRSAIERPQDILALLAYLDEEAGHGGVFAGLIDPERVAVVGHSYGGYTTLAAAGAQIDPASMQALCRQAVQAEEPGAWLCEQLTPHLDGMAALAGLDSVTPGLWPAWADPRIDAIVPMAGDAFFFGQDGLAKITAPVMAIGGTADKDSPYMWSAHPTYEYASSPRKARLALQGAGHMIFTGPCEKISWYLKFFSGEFCSDPGWDRVYAHDLVRHFTTAFLLAELKGDPNASAALSPEAVEFQGVSYDALGY